VSRGQGSASLAVTFAEGREGANGADRVEHQQARPDPALLELDMTSTITSVTFIVQNKLTGAKRFNADAKLSLAETFVVLFSGFEAFGTYLGATIVNQYYVRSVVVDTDTIAMEVGRGEPQNADSDQYHRFLLRI